MRRRGLYNEHKVFEAIRLRGTMPFSGAAIAAEAGVCRQTVYKIIDKLIDQGHRIEGAPRLGFMARLKAQEPAGAPQAWHASASPRP